MSDADPFAAGLRRFVDSLTHDAAGAERPPAEREALLAATRDMLNRLGREDGPGTKLTGEPLAPDAVFRAGQTVAGVFTVVSLINRGAFGELYRVRHRELGTDHALKVLQTGWNSDPTAMALLQNEARLLLTVRNDAVVGGQGLLRDGDGRPVLVMDFLRGPSLARVLRGGGLDLPDVLVLGQRLLAGLGALHARGIVHNDLSPGNVVLCDEQAGGATLVDLGVGRLLTELHGVHEGLDFAGKYTWVAPEQLDPRAPADTRSDLYSLGLVLAAAAMGRPLPMGEDEVVARHRRSQVPPLDGVPAPLRPTLTRLLQPMPTARLATAAQAAAMLAAAQPIKPRGFFRRGDP